MIVAILSVIFLLATILLPSRKAFGFLLIGMVVGVTPMGVDVVSYLMVYLFVKEITIKDLRNGRIQLNPLTKMYLSLLIVAFISFVIFHGVASNEILIAYIRILFPLIVVFKLYKSRDHLKVLIPFVWIALTVVLIHIYLQYLGVHPLSSLVKTKWGRLVPNDLANNYINSNTYSAYISWLSAILLGYYKVFNSSRYNGNNRKSFLTNVILISFFFISFPILGYLGSRANILLLFITYLVAFSKLSLTRVAFLLPIVLFFSSSFNLESYLQQNDIPLLGEATNARLDHMFYEFSGTDNKSRSSLLKAGITLFLDNPILGVGLGNEVKGIEDLTGQDMISHNTYVNLLSELGIMGVFLLLFLFWIWKGFFNQQLFFILLTSLFLYGLAHEIKILSMTWIVMAIFFIMMKILKNESLAR